MDNICPDCQAEGEHRCHYQEPRVGTTTWQPQRNQEFCESDKCLREDDA